MSQHVFSVSCFEVAALLAIATAFLSLGLTRVSVRDFGARAALTVTGHLRPRPDAAAEQALRTAFAELDRDLAEILGDRTVSGRAER